MSACERQRRVPPTLTPGPHSGWVTGWVTVGELDALAEGVGGGSGRRAARRGRRAYGEQAAILGVVVPEHPYTLTTLET